MLHGLSEEEKFKVLRPIIGPYEEDEFHMPIINKTSIENIDWSKIKVTNFKSVSVNSFLKNKFILMFCYDKDLIRLWNNPLKYIPIYQTATLITTPDFSVYPNMNYNEIRHNVFMGRWLGKLWQNYGCMVLPTIQWSTTDTYDICFSGIEKGSAVVVSTIGCLNNTEMFLEGFNEMKKRIKPELIVVFGDMIKGMTGRFINYRYKEILNYKNSYQQISLFDNEPIFNIKEEA